MSLFQNFVDVFTNFDPDIFRSLHDEDFMMVRETELSTRKKSKSMSKKNDYNDQACSISFIGKAGSSVAMAASR